MSKDFYNKVANKFGQYHTGSRYTPVYPGKSPEEVFKSNLLELSGSDNIALDLGCADGRFTMSIAPNFKSVEAIDISSGMLKSARKLQMKLGVNNVNFSSINAIKTDFPDMKFEVVYSRRGPAPFGEVFRLLKPGGTFVAICIGEKDTMDLKKYFGRGQNYEGWGNSVKSIIDQDAKQYGFVVRFNQEYEYKEYFSSYGDLDLFLQGVPIFEDYDSDKDKLLLEKYVDRYTSDKGILLDRHRVVYVLEKG